MTTNNTTKNNADANSIDLVPFTSYQLAFLAAVNDGCTTAPEIREVLNAVTASDHVEQPGASARRKTYETIDALESFGFVTTQKVGRIRFVDLTSKGYADVIDALIAAGLAEVTDRKS